MHVCTGNLVNFSALLDFIDVSRCNVVEFELRSQLLWRFSRGARRSNSKPRGDRSPISCLFENRTLPYQLTWDICVFLSSLLARQAIFTRGKLTYTLEPTSVCLGMCGGDG
jgi:hypothetical protein